MATSNGLGFREETSARSASSSSRSGCRGDIIRCSCVEWKPSGPYVIGALSRNDHERSSGVSGGFLARKITGDRRVASVTSLLRSCTTIG